MRMGGRYVWKVDPGQYLIPHGLVGVRQEVDALLMYHFGTLGLKDLVPLTAGRSALS